MAEDRSPERKAPAPLRLKRELAPALASARAENLPVAAVLVDTGLLHIDQEFDFLVPKELDQQITAGTLVKVPFNRRRVLGVVVDRKEKSDFRGELKFIPEVVKPFPIISGNILALVQEIKKYYGGSRWDGLRFAFPALSKKRSLAVADHAHGVAKPTLLNAKQPDERYPRPFWDALVRSPKELPPVQAYWFAPPCEDPFEFLVRLVTYCQKTALILLPDRNDVDRAMAALKKARSWSDDDVLTWHSDLSRSEREEVFLKILNNRVKIVVGVRGALLLPIQNLDLIIMWDEGSDYYSEMRAPYFHAREVALMRSRIDRAHLVLSGPSPSLQATQYLARRYLTPLTLSREQIRAKKLVVRGVDNSSAPQQMGRFPTVAWQLIKGGLKDGPVLVSVPLRGYIQALSCSRCLNQAHCSCGGKLVLGTNSHFPQCFVCGNLWRSWSCTFCSNQRFRHGQIGDQRIVEELGKAFPNTAILLSNAEHRVASVSNESLIVVATPGMEPLAALGYSAAVILNSDLSLSRASLSAEEDTRRKWFSIGTMMKESGSIFVDSDSRNRNVQALIRWDSLTVSGMELEERAPLQLPPIAKTAEIAGSLQAVQEIIRGLPNGTYISHPKQLKNGEIAAVIRIPPELTPEIMSELFARSRAQSSRGAEVARVKIDPSSL